MATYTKTTVTNRNNIVGPSAGTGNNYQATVDRMIQTYTRFDFGIHWSGTDGTVEFPAADLPQVGLVNDSIIAEGSPAWDPPSSQSAANAPLYVKWTAGTLPGTIKENYFSNGSLAATRDNVDPGFGSVHIQDSDPVDEGRSGPRYSFVLSGAEYRVYVNQSGFGQKPILIMSSDVTSGFNFPLHILGFASKKIVIRNIVMGGDNIPTSIYSLRDQTEDFGAVQNVLHLRIYQKGRYSGVDGISTDIQTPSIT
jgi:hypothetical protein